MKIKNVIGKKYVIVVTNVQYQKKKYCEDIQNRVVVCKRKLENNGEFRIKKNMGKQHSMSAMGNIEF